MGLDSLAKAIAPLPQPLAEQILGYARSVQARAEEIFLEANC